MDDITVVLKNLIDEYWKLSISENDFRNKIKIIFDDATNRGMVMRGLAFKAGFERKLGKKRIIELKKVLISIDGELYKGLLDR